MLEWSKTHVYSTLHICWGAQAGLYLRYGVEKYQMDSKLSGIYPQDTLKEGHLYLEALMIAMYLLIHGTRRFLRKRS